MRPTTSIPFIGLGLILLICGQAAAQTPPYPVLLTPVVYSDMTTVVLGADMSFQAWIVGNEADIIDLTSPGVAVGDGWIMFDLSVLPTAWEYGDTLVVNVHGDGSNYPQPEDREFRGILAAQGIQWITELGPNGEFYLPVELVSFWAKAREGAVTLQWMTRSEVDNAGYNLFRATSEDGAYQKINVKLIPGAGTTTNEHTYRYVDHPPLLGVYFYKLECVSTGGSSEYFGPIEVRMWRAAFKLYAMSPSPMITTARIPFELPYQTHVVLTVHDLAGRQMRTLCRGEFPAGYHTVSWDGLDMHGRSVKSGTYFIKMAAGDFRASEKVVILR